MRVTGSRIVSAVTLCSMFALSLSAQAFDKDAAKELAKKNNCLLCHGTDKDKVGPGFNKIAAKFKGNADAETRLINHLTSGEPAKFSDGHTAPHMIINTKDKAEIRNLVDWILSL